MKKSTSLINILKESLSPSSGLTKKEKSSIVKKAEHGKDIGKKGKGFKKVAKAAGGGEKGKKIAAAAMWKNLAKENQEYDLKSKWDILSPEEQEDKLLTVYKDPDDAQKYIGIEWKNLPEDVINRLNTLQGDELDEIEGEKDNEFYEQKYLEIKQGVMDERGYSDEDMDDEEIEDEVNRETDERFYEEFGIDYGDILDEATYAGKDAKDDIKKDPKYNTLSADAKKKVDMDLDKGGTATIGENDEEKICESFKRWKKNAGLI
jgi:hypothetical protein